MGDSKPLVIVLSRNYSTGLGVIRSLGCAGYTVDLIASVKKNGSSVIPSSSKYVRNSHEVLSTKIQGDDGKGIIDLLLKYDAKNEKIVLFPADDYTASIVANNSELLKDKFLFPYTVGDMLQAMDKSYQSELAKRAGLNVADEWVVDLRKDISVPNDVKYPCFVKPSQSINGSKSEMKVCENEAELQSHLEKMKAFYSNRDVIIQEYLKIDKEYDLSGVCLDDEVIIPALIEKIRIAKFEPGVTMSGRIIELDNLGSDVKKIIETLKGLRYFGMFDMELFSCNGKLYFNEINLRSGGPNYSYFLNGVNLPNIVVKALIGEAISNDEKSIAEYGKSFVYEKVAWEDYIHSFMTKKELNDCISSADYTLLADENDPNPGKVFFKRIRFSMLKHKAMMALGRE